MGPRGEVITDGTVTTESDREREVEPHEEGAERSPAFDEGRDRCDSLDAGEVDDLSPPDHERRVVLAGVRPVDVLDVDTGSIERDDDELDRDDWLPDAGVPKLDADDDLKGDDVVRDDERRTVARDDADRSATDATWRRSETKAAAAESSPPFTGERRTRSPGRAGRLL